MISVKSVVIVVTLILSLGIQSQVTNCNCCSDNHKAFDFWIGEWKVTNADGSIAGYNSIVKEEGNCLLKENWKS